MSKRSRLEKLFQKFLTENLDDDQGEEEEQAEDEPAEDEEADATESSDELDALKEENAKLRAIGSNYVKDIDSEMDRVENGKWRPRRTRRQETKQEEPAEKFDLKKALADDPNKVLQDIIDGKLAVTE